jgi:outer membrane immunogenic protein
MIRQLLAGGLLTVAIAGTAGAADLPIRATPVGPIIVPGFQWEGFYLGANLGGHWGQDRITTSADSAGQFGGGGAAAIDGVTPVTLDPSGFIGGAQAGYNWQFGSAVVGIEGDVNWLRGTAGRTLGGFAVINPSDVMTNSTQSNFLATVRPRLGWAFDRVLVYVTGGYAYGRLQTSDTFGFFGNTATGTANAVSHSSGWTAGTGAEWAFFDNWSVKLEYLYVNLGTFNNIIPGPDAATNITVHHNYSDNIVRAGLNYRFSW